ncbi:class I SAM-dependent methyltransferase [Gluconacetobacter sp. 1b LMG 1731]|uniref:Class I SAM-dependent methyltransferase n=1 Tax=Gluconacetobacter dulcium TaxID=2729096 RepID=A0A7W4IPD7_9PROT|nr:class I SAM-dependent methyltransferase [Gluconacetobacter dulcium]MBB2166611.1 class I SAM-dependent methyltransferase [Gluconacetobacter dulcium]MBB2195699.1 class I SAM-dependent methyltransferase [Gluconacetobacter dulcium]
MSEAKRHYDRLLAAHYSWMSGAPLEKKVAEQRGLLTDLGLNGGPKGIAVDLGCGPGYQSFALIDMGYNAVIAVDTSADLLAELKKARTDSQVKTVLADLRDFPMLVEQDSADAIVCMGDTLTHLDERSDVSKLYRDAYAALAPGGRFVLTFRDLSQELTGLDRFLSVRADDQRVMTCVLEYEPECVIVNDLIHVREESGWIFQKSRYRKLRLSPSEQVAELKRIGFTIDHDRPIDRMHAISARK